MTTLAERLQNGGLVTSDRSIVRKRRVRCKLCREEREVEVDTWDDRVEPTFEHECKGKGPALGKPVNRAGDPIPFFPVGDRVVVERLPEEAVTAGGLHIPETSQEQQQYATVIAAGPPAQGVLDDMGIKVGDTITFAKYSGVNWTWIPKGKGAADRCRVDLLNVKDIQGGAELAEKMMDGRLGIALHSTASGEQEYRFFEEVSKGETT